MKPVSPAVDAPHEIVGANNETSHIGALSVVKVKDPNIPDEPDGEPVPWNSWMTAWQPDADELAKLARGADIYITQLTGFGAGPHALAVHVGKEAAAAAYRVPVLNEETIAKRNQEAQAELEKACREAIDALKLMGDPQLPPPAGEFSIRGNPEQFAKRGW